MRKTSGDDSDRFIYQNVSDAVIIRIAGAQKSVMQVSAMTEGTLSDKAMNDDGIWIARIDDKPYPVLGYVLPFLEKIEKGARCEYTLKDGKVSKISRVKNNPQGTPTDKPGVVDVAGDAVDKAKEKMAKAGFADQKPAAGLPKTVTGVIKEISQESRKLVVYIWDAKAKLPITWAASRDAMMASIKAEDKVKITYEVGDPNLLIDLQMDKPKGGGNFVPRKPRFTIGFTIPLAQFESVRIDVEGNSPEECKVGLAESINSLGKNNEAVRDLLQKFKARVL